MALFLLCVVPVVGAVLLTLCKAIYLSFLHPLANYPGPFIAKFTSLYAAYHGWNGDVHLDIWRCHERYGPVVRYGPKKLLFSSAEALKDIYSTGTLSTFLKADAYAPLVHRSPNVLTIRGGREHGRRRRIVSQGVSEKAQRSYEKRIATHVEKCCRMVYSSSQPVDIATWTSYLLFDIMSDVVFGAEFNLLEKAAFRHVPDTINRSNVRMSTLFQSPRLAKIGWVKQLFPDAIAARNLFVPFVSRVVKERLLRQKANDDGQGILPDVFANISAAKDPQTGESFTNNEIAAESRTLIVAGSDTTSTALSGVFFYLAHNSLPRKKAMEEVRAAFKSREDIAIGASLNSCTYLRACVDESLRMSPPVGVPLWRQARSEVTIDTTTIPAGCDVGMSIYTMHHSPTCLPDPFEYKPERWLATDGSAELARQLFNPFSIGNRACLGKGLAMTELLLIMATVLFNGDFDVAAGDLEKVGRGDGMGEYGRHREDEYQLKDHITGHGEGPWLRFAARTS